ncbi:MAG: hypothetical protein AAGB32_05420, partial [Pseudomonadota bacterium]
MADNFHGEQPPLKSEEDVPFLDPLAPKIIANEKLKDIPSHIIRQAWFTTAHLLLEDGAQVLDIKCGNGINAYT